MNVTSTRQTFRKLHADGCFILPNPWDTGSARLLAQLGFRALATTSAGLAWSLGLPDNGATLEEALAHFRAVVSAVDIPVNADFEGGFARDPDGVATNVTSAAATGLAGLSIEDSTGNAAEPLYPFDLAVERVRAARASIDRHAAGLVLTARTEGFIVGRPDLPETLRRLRAFSDAGADCLYAPGIRSDGEIREVVAAVAPKPVNVLAMGGASMTLAGLAEMGVRRISVGGSLARVAWAGFLEAATEMSEKGTFKRLNRGIPGDSLNARFARQ